MEALGPVLIVFSLPLIFRWVPRNRIYGLRVPSTLRSESVWYDANALSGRWSLLLGLLMIALEFIVPSSSLIQTLRFVALAGLALVVGLTWRKANQWDRERRGRTA